MSRFLLKPRHLGHYVRRLWMIFKSSVVASSLWHCPGRRQDSGLLSAGGSRRAGFPLGLHWPLSVCVEGDSSFLLGGNGNYRPSDLPQIFTDTSMPGRVGVPCGYVLHTSHGHHSRTSWLCYGCAVVMSWLFARTPWIASQRGVGRMPYHCWIRIWVQVLCVVCTDIVVGPRRGWSLPSGKDESSSSLPD